MSKWLDDWRKRLDLARYGNPVAGVQMFNEAIAREPVTIYEITSKYGGGYWTTDRAIVDEDVRVDVEENDGSMQFVVTERQVSRAEFERMEANDEGREFPGW